MALCPQSGISLVKSINCQIYIIQHCSIWKVNTTNLFLSCLILPQINCIFKQNVLSLPCSQCVCEFLIFTYRHLWKIRCFRLSEAGKLKFSVSQVPLCHSFGQLNVSDVCWKELPWKILKKENSADIASLAHIPACDTV